jgi:hypothetical protein
MAPMEVEMILPLNMDSGPLTVYLGNELFDTPLGPIWMNKLNLSTEMDSMRMHIRLMQFDEFGKAGMSLKLLD